MRVWIYGDSDDLIEVGGGHPMLREEYPCYDTPWTATLFSPTQGAMRVGGEFTPEGVWKISAWQMDEEMPFPEHWEVIVTRSTEAEHSTQLMILNAPDDVEVRDPDPAADGTRKEKK